MDYIKLEKIQFDVKGKIIKTVSVKDEWILPIKNPLNVIAEIRTRKIKGILFTFVQNLNETNPKYSYYMELDNVAALPISTYDEWFTKKIHSNVRNKIKKSEKKGIIVKKESFSDNLVLGLMEIFNETPIRRGRRYIYYGKDFNNIKKVWATDLDRSEFLVAYFEEKIVGFIKLCYGNKYARTSGTVAKLSYRDKSPMNALFAATVKRCAEKGYSYLVYGKFAYGKKGEDSLSKFKKYNGFIKIEIPRYYVPLSNFGKIVLKIGLHHGLIDLFPKGLLNILIQIREKWNNRKYRRHRK